MRGASTSSPLEKFLLMKSPQAPTQMKCFPRLTQARAEARYSFIDTASLSYILEIFVLVVTLPSRIDGLQ